MLAAPYTSAGSEHQDKNIGIHTTLKGGVVSEYFTNTGVLAPTGEDAAGLGNQATNSLISYGLHLQEAGDKLGLQAGGDIGFQ